MANQEILETFYESETYSVTPQGFSLKINSRRLMGRISPVEIKDKDGKETIVEKGQRITARHIRLIDSNKIKTISLDSEGLNGLITAEDIINKETGELLISCNSVIDETIVKAIQEQKLKEIKVLYINELESGPYISETLRSDTTTSQLEALAEIYRMMRPGEPPTKEAATNLFENLFFNSEKYDLSDVGRMKFNRRLGREDLQGDGILSKEDIIDVTKTLVDIRNGKQWYRTKSELVF